MRCCQRWFLFCAKEFELACLRKIFLFKEVLGQGRLILASSFKKFLQDRCLITAQALTYTTLFSLIPALAIAFSIFQALGGLEQIEPQFFKYLFELLTPGRQQVVLENMEEMIQKARQAPIGAFSTAFFLVVATFLVMELEDGLNRIWRTRGHRPFWQRVFVYWSSFTLWPVLIAAPLTVGIFLAHYQHGALILRYFPIVDFLRLAPVLSIWIFLWLVYFFLPNTHVSLAAAATGTLSAGGLWLIAAKLYTIYTKKVFIYSMLYGSIGVIPVFLIWLLISWSVILFGAELSYCLQNRHALKIKETPEKIASLADPARNLRFIILVYWHFYKGDGPSSIETIGCEAGLMPAEAGLIAGRFLEAGLLALEASSGGVMPKAAPKDLSIGDILRHVPSYGLSGGLDRDTCLDRVLFDVIKEGELVFNERLSGKRLDVILEAIDRCGR